MSSGYPASVTQRAGKLALYCTSIGDRTNSHKSNLSQQILIRDAELLRNHDVLQEFPISKDHAHFHFKHLLLSMFDKISYLSSSFCNFFSGSSLLWVHYPPQRLRLVVS